MKTLKTTPIIIIIIMAGIVVVRLNMKKSKKMH